MGDTGILTAPSGVVEVANTKKLPNGITILLGQVVEGFVTVGDKITASVNSNRKNDIARNHTATPLVACSAQGCSGAPCQSGRK